MAIDTAVDMKVLAIKEKSKELSAADKDALKLETALGHKQALNRNFGLFSLTSLGIIIAK
jgi:choline transport protein